MKAQCKYMLYVPDYLDNTLQQSIETEFVSHLKDCRQCAQHLESLKSVHNLLHTLQRPEPDVSQLFAYQTKLEKQFPVHHPVREMFHSLSAWLTSIRFKHPVILNTSGAFALVLIGIIIGKFIFYTPQYQPVTGQPAAEIQIITPGSNDYRLISEYIVKSEILLLAIKNSSNGAQKRPDDLLPEKQLAHDLLVSFPQIQNNFIVLQDRELNKLLEKLELVLLEVSNSEDQEIVLVFRELKKVIDKTKLVNETQKIQQKIEKLI